MQGNVTILNNRQILTGMKRLDPPLRAGLSGIGLETCWAIFQGLKERLEACVQAVSKMLARPGMEIVNLGLRHSPERAMEAGRLFRREDVDVIFLYASTYALFSALLNLRIETVC